MYSAWNISVKVCAMCFHSQSHVSVYILYVLIHPMAKYQTKYMAFENYLRKILEFVSTAGFYIRVYVSNRTIGLLSFNIYIDFDFLLLYWPPEISCIIILKCMNIFIVQLYAYMYKYMHIFISGMKKNSFMKAKKKKLIQKKKVWK